MFRTTLIALSILPVIACGTPMESDRGALDESFSVERQAVVSYSIKASTKFQKETTLTPEVIVNDDDDQTMQDCVDQSFDVYECLDCCVDAFPEGGEKLDECDAGCSDQCPEEDPWDKINECLDDNTNTADCQSCCNDAFRNDPSTEEICNDQCDELCEDDECDYDTGGFGSISG